jgi:hypothetical protein
MTRFHLAQTFYIDRDLVQQAAEVRITKVALFFKNKPKISGNRSGIYSPGVEVFIVPTYFGVPLIDGGGTSIIQTARVEYNEVNVSSTALTPTLFCFSRPPRVKTSQEYAIVVKYDGDEDFQLWDSREGDYLLGTTLISPGPSGKYIGKMFLYASDLYQTNDNPGGDIQHTSDQDPLGQNLPPSDYLLSAWKPVNDTDLKFQIEVARYSHGGVCVLANSEILDNNFVSIVISNNVTILSNNTIRIDCPAYPMEYVYFDKKSSLTDDVVYGDFIYQHQPYYPGSKATPATVSVTDGSILVNTNLSYVLSDNTTFDFEKLFEFGRYPEYITVISLNHNGSGAHLVNVRLIAGLANNTMIVKEPFTFSNSGAYFFKSPVARLYSKTRPYISGHTKDLIVLSDSNANSSCRFVNDAIVGYTVVSGGSAYANSDYVVVSGFEAVPNEVMGGYSARANVETYANGTIRYLYFSNGGAGFVNTSDITYLVLNSSATNSTGTGANLTFSANTYLYPQFQNQNNYFKAAKIVNFDAQQMLPVLQINNPMGTVYSLKYKSLYHSIPSANTISARTWLVDSVSDAAIELDVKNNVLHNFGSGKHPAIVSRSNQFVIGYANGSIPNTSIVGTYFSNTAKFIIDAFSNNDFAGCSFEPSDLNSYYAKYNINNDYTNEHQNYGNAFAKHVTTKINFANGQSAEDLLVFIQAYRPQNTDIKVYARVHNATDTEAFDDKDWSLLEQVDGIGVFSSLTNPADRVEMTFGFPAYPNTTIAANTTNATPTQGLLAGVVTTQLNNNAIVGVGTTFSSNLAANDIVKIYQPLFPNADYMIAVVNNVVNNTVFNIRTAVSNNSLVASGMKVAKVYYPYQVFKNITNDNVARYYSQSKVEYDTFDTWQLKIVLLSPNDYVVPKIDDVRAVGVTA